MHSYATGDASLRSATLWQSAKPSPRPINVPLQRRPAHRRSTGRPMGVTSEQITAHLHQMNNGCGKLSRSGRPIHYHADSGAATAEAGSGGPEAGGQTRRRADARAGRLRRAVRPPAAWSDERTERQPGARVGFLARAMPRRPGGARSGRGAATRQRYRAGETERGING